MQCAHWVKWPGLLVVIIIAISISNTVQADTVTLDAKLTGVSPSDIVYITDATYGYNNLEVYAGQLLWTSEGPGTPSMLPAGKTFGTYCIDIVHDISIGGAYPFDLDPVTSAPALLVNNGLYQYAPGLTVSTSQAIEDLWHDHYAQSLTGAPGLSANDASAAFQIDLWTILYGSTGFSASPAGGQTGWMLPAANWITGLDSELASGTKYSVNGLDAMVAQSAAAQGQDQLLATPLPPAFWSGFVLLMGYLTFRFARGRHVRFA